MVMVQGLFDRCFPPEMGVDLPRPFPQKEAPDVAGKVLAGFERTAKTAIEDKSEGSLADEFFHDLAREGSIFRPGNFHFHRDKICLIPLEGPAHPAPQKRPPDHAGHKIPPRPKEGDDFNLPKRPSHLENPCHA
jgi:hypothetical protein